MSIEKIKELRDLTKAGLSDVKKALESTNYNIDKAIIWLRENGILKAASKANRIASEGIIKIKFNKEKIVIIEVNTETDFVASNDFFQKAIDSILETILNSDIETVDQLNDLKIDNQSFQDYMALLMSTIGEKIQLRRMKVFSLSNDISFASYVHTNNKIGSIVIAKNIDNTLLRDIAMHIVAMSPEFLSINNITENRKKMEFDIAKKELAESIKNKPESVQEKIIDGKVSKNLSEIVLFEQSFIKDSSVKIKDLQGKGEVIDFIRFEVGSGLDKKIENFAEEVSKQVNLDK